MNGDIGEINKLVGMLASTDEEMQNLGMSIIIMTEEAKMVLYTLPRDLQIIYLKLQLCSEVYELEKEKSEQLKRDYGKRND